ncbi:MAG: hypothetical protein Dbin4_02850 [Alphaproteobacteria bacterium]|nr:hypothetical protein [Alphaproteobacteria bacterium]
MDQSILSSRAIIGMYYASLETNPGLAWIDGVSNLFGSDQASETYAFLGASPKFREWTGGRQALGIPQNSFAITNKHYEATLEIAVRDARRDKTGQIMARVSEFSMRAQTHWASLLSDLLIAARSTVCYDGQFFFDTDHSEGSSGIQDNDITVDISTFDSARDVVTNPTAIQAQAAIVKAIAQILSFKDDKGEPMNENAMSFLVVVPIGLYIPMLAAINVLTTAAMTQNINPTVAKPGMLIDVQMNPRLTWTDSFAVFRTDSPIKAFIRQSEKEVELKAKAEGSEFEFDNDAWQFGIDTWRNVGYGYWQRAVLVTMI